MCVVYLVAVEPAVVSLHRRDVVVDLLECLAFSV